MAEFILACVGVSMDVLALLNHEWGLGKVVCVATGTLVTTSGMNNVYCFCLLFLTFGKE